MTHVPVGRIRGRPARYATRYPPRGWGDGSLHLANGERILIGVGTGICGASAVVWITVTVTSLTLQALTGAV
jgi:hypothetical protein